MKFPNSANYLPGISRDPTTGQFWDQFNADPAIVNQGKQPGEPGFRSFDTRRAPAELAPLQTNGFVVSERLGADSFADIFYHFWHDDLPVFISTDARLQAWHRTYDAMLEEVEETSRPTFRPTASKASRRRFGRFGRSKRDFGIRAGT